MEKEVERRVKWKRLAKNTKALSPVIATIILVAVTVAVAIAVAAWMGALSFTYLKAPEEIQFTNTVITNTTVAMTVRNGGPNTITINKAYVNDIDQTSNVTPALPQSITQGDQKTLTVAGNYTSGVKYTVKLVTAQGTQFPIVVIAP